MPAGFSLFILVALLWAGWQPGEHARSLSFGYGFSYAQFERSGFPLRPTALRPNSQCRFRNALSAG
jgi:hypothetical protein